MLRSLPSSAQTRPHTCGIGTCPSSTLRMRHLVQRRQSENGHRSRIAIGPTWNRASSFGKNRMPRVIGGCSGSSATPFVLPHMRRAGYQTILLDTQWRPHLWCGQDYGPFTPRTRWHGEWIRAACAAQPAAAPRRAKDAWRPGVSAVIAGLTPLKSVQPPELTRISVPGASPPLNGRLGAVGARPLSAVPMYATEVHANAWDAHQRTGYVGRVTFPALTVDRCNVPAAQPVCGNGAGRATTREHANLFQLSRSPPGTTKRIQMSSNSKRRTTLGRSQERSGPTLPRAACGANERNRTFSLAQGVTLQIGCAGNQGVGFLGPVACSSDVELVRTSPAMPSAACAARPTCAV